MADSDEQGGATPRPIRQAKDLAFTRAGVAVGVGSAALVAALLYAGRPKRQKPAK